MRAFLGRTAVYWQPFLMTVIGFSVLVLWYANLPSGKDYLFGPPELRLWLAVTLLFGLPAMGTACALVGARTRQSGAALVAGLAGLYATCLVLALVAVQPTFLVVVAMVASVPFLVGFGAGWFLARPHHGTGGSEAEGRSSAASRICVHCGKEVRADRERYCNHCGELFASGSPEAPPITPGPPSL